MPNPYQSPNAQPEERRSLGGGAALGKGLASGTLTWGLVTIAARMQYGRFWDIRPEGGAPYELYVFLLGPLHFLTEALGFYPADATHAHYLYLLKVLSGFLLHNAFWTLLFTLWRRTAERCTQAPAQASGSLDTN